MNPVGADWRLLLGDVVRHRIFYLILRNTILVFSECTSVTSTVCTRSWNNSLGSEVKLTVFTAIFFIATLVSRCLTKKPDWI